MSQYATNLSVPCVAFYKFSLFHIFAALIFFFGLLFALFYLNKSFKTETERLMYKRKAYSVVWTVAFCCGSLLLFQHIFNQIMYPNYCEKAVDMMDQLQTNIQIEKIEKKLTERFNDYFNTKVRHPFENLNPFKNIPKEPLETDSIAVDAAAAADSQTT